MRGNVLPTSDERKDWVRSIGRQPDLVETAVCVQFLDRYRAYTQATGHTHFLVRTFNNIAVKVAGRDRRRSVWALGLMEEALAWEPLNPRNWTSYAGVLTAAKRTDQALRTLWHARYRFPWNAVIRNELGRLLRETGDLPTSQAVLREAVAQFPDNVVSRTSLAETLRALDKLDEARQLLEEARRDFAGDVVCRTSLGDLLPI